MGNPEGPAREPARVEPHRFPVAIQKVLLPDRLRRDESKRHAALTAVLFGVSMSLWCLVFIPVHIALGSDRCALIIVGAGVAFIGNAVALRAHGSLALISNVTAAIALVTLLALSVHSGGYLSAAMLWLPSVPMIAILLSGWRTGSVWLLLTTAAACTIYLLDQTGSLPPSDFGEENARLLFILGLLGIISCITLLSFLFETIADALRTRLEAARESAVEASHAKSAFLARMSHEIRTPMNGVLGMLELLGNTKVTGQQREYTRFARQSAESLLQVLNDILDFSKIEVGRLELESIPFDLREVVGDTLQSLAADAETKGIELACHIQPEVPTDLEGDPGRLRQILVNLVGNAIKFTAEGEVVVTIAESSGACDLTRLDFCVRDTGVGIPPEKHGLIWDVFGQADTSTTRKFGGTGLGLNICRQLVRMMGGNLAFVSEEGEGTTFSFTLELGLPGAERRPVAPPDASLHGVRVLVVDDNATNRFVLEEILTQWSMEVTSVDSARPAMAALHRTVEAAAEIQVVLLDVMMPDTDGLMLAEEIRRESQFDGIPLIILSSAYSTESRAHCEALGIVGQLRKPVKQSELLDALLLALHPDSLGAGKSPPSREAPATKSVRILLAEDGPVNRRVAVGLLENQGHRVTAVEDGRKAVKAWQEGEFDLILMDLEMPDVDGLEATRRIRREEQVGETRIPIVALTAHAIREFEERCMEAGMDAHLAKPLEPKRLYATIRELT